MDQVIAFAKLDINVPPLQHIFKDVDITWQPHYNYLHYNGNWDVLPLRSPNGNNNAAFAETMGNGEFQDTIYIGMFPEVKLLLQSLQCPLLSARFLNLKAGSVIKQHRDHELSFEQGEARLHFPVITNNDVEFYLNDEHVKMQPEECWYINANLPHRVANKGTTDRIHLVVDCVVNEWLTEIFNRSKKVFHTIPPDLKQIKLMISELRRQQTAKAMEMADEMELKYGHLLTASA